MKVSIITVCYNAENTIEDTIKSIISQNFGNIEYIVIDGNSTDGTLDILKRFEQHIDHLISEPDKGIYDAMNKGIRLASGDIIATLNSDDFYATHDIVNRMVKLIEKKELDAVYGDLAYVDRMNTDHITRYWKAGEYKRKAFYRGWVPPHPTFFCRKNLFEKYGYFNETVQIAADFELLLRFIEKYQIKVGYIPEVVVKMRTQGRANRLRGIIRGNAEIIRSFRANGLRFHPCFFVCKSLTKISQFFARPTPVQ